MQFFLLWLAVILLALAGYLAFLWWHPRKRSRFQVRLTVLFLLFALLPTVPLIFIASILATDTADVLLVPEVEAALAQAIAALKLQFEDTATRFVDATTPEQVSPELLARWNFESYRVWQRQQDRTHLRVAVMRAGHAPANVDFNLPQDSWGQRGSSLELLQRGDSLTARCRVWQPRALDAMVLVEFRIAPEIVAAKEQLTRTLRVYNSLSLIKERALQDQIIWGAAILLVAGLSLLAIFVARKRARALSRPLEDLISVTNQVAAGDLQIQSESQAQDEIRQLVDAFNAAALAVG
ncbi:MAG: HAMP domain-containing protein, partial [candidate division KSB1 bacterium]